MDTDLPEAGADDVPVRVHAAALNPYDWHIMRGDSLIARLMGEVGLTKPKAWVTGIDAAGRVEAVGANVHGLRRGYEVLGFCRGAAAEYARGGRHGGAQAGEPDPPGHLRALLVAAVNGHSIAGGYILTAAADLILMAESPGLVGVTRLLVGVPFPAIAQELHDDAIGCCSPGPCVGPASGFGGLCVRVSSPPSG